jgi:ABC-type glycerol-3-phosphate transport system substrate-binding protein
MKKITTFLLTITLLFTLTACGGGETTSADAPGTGAGAAGAADIRAGSGENYIVVPFKTLERGQAAALGEYVYDNRLYYLCYAEGQAAVTRIDLDNPAIEETISVALPEGQEIWYYGQIAVSSDGTINILTISVNREDSSNIYTSDLFWHQIDGAGHITKTVSTPEAMRGGNAILPLLLEIDGVGNAYIILYYDFNREEPPYEMFVLDPTGAVLMQATVNFPHFMLRNPAGEVFLQHNGGAAGGGRAMYLLSRADLAESRLVEYADLTSYGISGLLSGVGLDAEGLYFLAHAGGVYDYDRVGAAWVQRFGWNAIRTRVGDDRNYPLADGRILRASRPEGSGLGEWGPEVTYSIVRPKTAADITAEEAAAQEFANTVSAGGVGGITVGAVGRDLGQAVSQAIDDFNESHPYSPISVKQYGVLYGDDQSEGLTQLNNDIIRGDCPDILLLPSELSFGAYVTQGVFRDLSPYLQNDENIAMSDYRENVFRAYEVGGGLYGVPIAYYVDTVYGKASELAGIEGFDMDGLIAFADRFPDSRIFHRPTKTAVLDLCLRANGGNIVDWASAGGDFDRGMMIKMLEFANRFIDEDKYAEERMLTARINAGDIHLMAGAATTIIQMQTEVFGGPVSAVGYPCENGGGHLINATLVAAISSKCAYNETAWEFIRYLLGEEVQSSIYLPGYPVKKSCLESYLESAKEGGGSISMHDADLDISFEVRGASDADIELFLHLMDTADTIRAYDQQIDQIIKEEAGAYFAGQKPVGEVVDIIENRVGIYVKETK